MTSAGQKASGNRSLLTRDIQIPSDCINKVIIPLIHVLGR